MIGKKIEQVTRQLAGRFGLSSALVIFGRLCTLLLFLTAARFAGAEAFGLFVFAHAACQVLGILCSLGTGPASQLIIGEARGHARLARIPSFVLFASVTTLGVSAAVALLLWAGSLAAEGLEAGGNARALLAAMAIFLPAMAMSMLREYLARALELVVLSFVPRDIVWCLSMIALIVLVPEIRSNLVLTGAIVLMAIELPLWLALWRRARRQAAGARKLPARAYRSWTVRSLAMLANSLAGFCFERVDILAMGAFGPLSAAGVYGAASRTAPLISTTQRFIVPIITVRVARALAIDDVREAWREVRSGIAAATCVALPATLFVLLFAPQIMSLFGPGFESGANVLRILACAHFVLAIGSNISVLIMFGKQPWLFTRAIWMALIPTAIAMPFTIHFLGASGAALTAAVGIVAYNLRTLLISRALLKGERSRDAVRSS